MRTITKTPNRVVRNRRARASVANEVVSVDGRLDASSARGLVRSVSRLLAAGFRRCTIDLSAVDAVDSAGFGSLMGSVRKIEEAGGTAIVVCANPTVRRLFEIAGITRLVHVVRRLSDAAQVPAA